jgi:excinuclease ABC subunit C
MELSEKKLMEEFLGELSKKKVEIKIPQAGAKLSLIKDQEQIALQILEQRISENLNTKELLLEVKKIFDLPKIPQRIEVYDNSHTGGQNAVGALITAGPDGFIKSGYRKFNLFKNQTPQQVRGDNLPSLVTPSNDGVHSKRDDTSMLKEVLMRRFSKLEKKDYPDFIIIDGGKGQLSAAQKIFDELGVKIDFACMSKGEDRNAGEEFFHQIKSTHPTISLPLKGRGENDLKRSFSASRSARLNARDAMTEYHEKTKKNFEIKSFTLPKHSPTMHYLQRLRDEAHRFAIMTHRKKRQKNMLN